MEQYHARSPWARRIEVSPGGEYLVEVDQTRSTDWAAGGGLLVRETADWSFCRRCRVSDNTTGRRRRQPDCRFIATGHILHVGLKTKSLGAQWGHYTTNDYDYVVHLRDFHPGE